MTFFTCPICHLDCTKIDAVSLHLPTRRPFNYRPAPSSWTCTNCLAPPQTDATCRFCGASSPDSFMRYVETLWREVDDDV